MPCQVGGLVVKEVYRLLRVWPSHRLSKFKNVCPLSETRRTETTATVLLVEGKDDDDDGGRRRVLYLK